MTNMTIDTREAVLAAATNLRSAQFAFRLAEERYKAATFAAEEARQDCELARQQLTRASTALVRAAADQQSESNIWRG